MKCPVDGETLVMADRSGVEIDYCPKCRGVWLDRGELDKIIDRVDVDRVISRVDIEAVIAGLGLALLPRHAVRLELAHGLLRELPVEELPLQRSWCVVHPRGKHLSPVAQAFRDFIRGERAQIAALSVLASDDVLDESLEKELLATAEAERAAD
mgnify:CR=1 FL=1